MAYDIYGNSLRRGHCEVHPHVHEEYPCSLCYAEAEKYEHQQREKKHYERMERLHYEEQEKWYYESLERDYLKSIYPAGDKDLITDKAF